MCVCVCVFMYIMQAGENGKFRIEVAEQPLKNQGEIELNGGLNTQTNHGTCTVVLQYVTTCIEFEMHT